MYIVATDLSRVVGSRNHQYSIIDASFAIVQELLSVAMIELLFVRARVSIVGIIGQK